jgi:hypothetical protein
MSHRLLASLSVLVAVIAFVALAPVLVVGQSQSAAAATKARDWTPPRTPWGAPDLQGVWDYRTITPLQRPDSLTGKQVLTDEEAAVFEREENRRQNRDLVDRQKGNDQYPPLGEGGVGGVVVPYNEFWYDRGSKVIGSKRTSLIVDPPDGRVPPFTPQRVRSGGGGGGNSPANPEDLTLGNRCVARDFPRVPGAYNNNVQIVQGPGYVVFIHEMAHDARVVPLDGRPHLPPTMRQWMGDARGRWEGNTLVVDTTNFTAKTNFQGSGENLHLVERFKLMDAKTLSYEFTVDDATTWTRPWTVEFPMMRNPERIYEYACHEGNYAVFDILAGARADDKKAAAEAANKSK